MFRNIGHEGSLLKGETKSGLMAGDGCTQQTFLYFLCDDLEYHLKDSSILET